MQHMTSSISSKWPGPHHGAQRNVVDIVNKASGPTQIQNWSTDLLIRWIILDQVIRDSVSKLWTAGLQDSLHWKMYLSPCNQSLLKSYRKHTTQVSVPGRENLQHTLTNLNQSFLAGTKEYESTLRSRLEMSRKHKKDELVPVWGYEEVYFYSLPTGIILIKQMGGYKWASRKQINNWISRYCEKEKLDLVSELSTTWPSCSYQPYQCKRYKSSVSWILATLMRHSRKLW